MKIDQKFEVTFKMNKYPKEDSSIQHEGVLSDKMEKVDITLKLSAKQAACFLFRFYTSMFKIDNYNIAMRYDEYHKLRNIIFIKDDYIYIVYNMNQVLVDIHEGYFRLLAMDKFNSILEFDFDIEEDDEIHEEFEDEE